MLGTDSPESGRGHRLLLNHKFKKQNIGHLDYESWGQMVPCSWVQMVLYSWAQIVPKLSWHKKGEYTERGEWRKREPPYSSKIADKLGNISTYSENIRI